MKKPNFLKLLLPLGVLLILFAFIIGHFMPLSEPMHGFLKGLGITLVVAYFLKASMQKTAWYK